MLGCLRLLLIAFAAPIAFAQTVTLIQFSDYHSHALPHYTESGMRGGIARAIGYLEREKKHGALVFSGGDTINRGAPAWSDRFLCAEWPWLNGIVDAMALGNHEADYGRTAFDVCRDLAQYPVLSANTPGFPAHRLFVKGGIRVGVFALAGADFEKLGVAKNLGAGAVFTDPIEAARQAVHELRNDDHADLVVMIGHEHAGEDAALARSVPGIDLIFGSHSHLERGLVKIDGTDTWFLSAGQYLENVARVEVSMKQGKVAAVRGGLVPMDESIPESERVRRRVERMQRDLENDPIYAPLFVPVGTLASPWKVADVAGHALEAMRVATGSSVAMSTKSSFRGALPAGKVTLEQLRDAMPYDNEIVVCEMDGSQLEKVLAESDRRAGTDSNLFVARPASMDAAATYRVAATDFLVNFAYREVFHCNVSRTGLRVRNELRKSLSH